MGLGGPGRQRERARDGMGWGSSGGTGMWGLCGEGDRVSPWVGVGAGLGIPWVNVGRGPRGPCRAGVCPGIRAGRGAVRSSRGPCGRGSGQGCRDSV